MYRMGSGRTMHNSYQTCALCDLTPSHFYKVKCVPTCMPESGKLDFPETTAGEHVAYMYEKTYGKSA